MLFSDVVYLQTETVTKNALGDKITDPSERMVFANKKSIKQSEFYQAQATGFKPELTFEIHISEYNGESELRYINKDYRIIRTYENGETLELTCEGAVSHGTS